MDYEKLTKDYFATVRQSCRTVFDSGNFFCDFNSNIGQYWACKLGLDENRKTMINKWRVFAKEGIQISRNIADTEAKFLENSALDLNSFLTALMKNVSGR